jgi:hypothetical protein
MARIGHKTLRASKFMKVKTFGDALRFAGYPIQDDADIEFTRGGALILTKASARFEFVPSVHVKGTVIPITKLYGK